MYHRLNYVKYFSRIIYQNMMFGRKKTLFMITQFQTLMFTLPYYFIFQVLLFSLAVLHGASSWLFPKKTANCQPVGSRSFKFTAIYTGLSLNLFFYVFLLQMYAVYSFDSQIFSIQYSVFISRARMLTRIMKTLQVFDHSERQIENSIAQLKGQFFHDVH